MKKITVLLLLCLSLPALLLAQVDNLNFVDQQVNIRQLATLNPGSVGARGFDNRYEGVRGTPLLFEDWQRAKINVVGGTEEGADADINLNQYDHQLVVQFPDGQAGVVPASKIKRVEVETAAGNRRFEAFPASLVEGSEENEVHFYEVLYQGEITLLKAHEKIFQKANYKGAYSADRRYDEFLDQQRYYLRGPEGPFIKLNKLKSKAIEKALPTYESQIQKIARQNRLNLREEKQVVRLFRLLEK